MTARPVLFVLAFAAISCSKSDSGSTTPAPTVATVAVSQDATLVPQQTSQLTATPKDASGTAVTGKTVTWSSGSTAVATVSASGLVTAVTVGTATITATADGKSGSATMTVKDGGLVGAAGGTVSALSGTVKITVPAGALSASTPLSVAASTVAVTDPRIVPGAVYDIGPSGTQFGAGTTLSLTYDPTKVRAIDQQADLRLFTVDATGKWTPLNAAGTGSVDATAHVVTGPLPHLSTIGVASVNAVQNITSATVGQLPTSPGFSNTVAKLSTVTLFSATTNAFGVAVSPQGTPTVTSSDATKVSVSGVAKATGGAQGVTFTLTGVDVGAPNITVTADGEASTFPVTVTPGPTMTIAVSPSSLTTPQGTAATGAATVTITKSFTAATTLSYTSTAPLYLSGTFTPSVVPSTSSTSALSVGASPFLVPGAWALTINASSTPAGATIPVTASATYTATVTPTAGSVTISSADPTKPLTAAWIRPTPTGAWTTIACANNACPITFDPAATALSLAVVRPLGGGMYHNYFLNLSGDEMPYLGGWFANETRATTTATWAVTNLPSGSTFTGFIGSEKQSTTTSLSTLSFSKAPSGMQNVSGILSSAAGLKYYYNYGLTNIGSSAVIPPVDLSQAGIAPELHTLTFSDPLNLGGTASWTIIGGNVDGSGFTEVYSSPFSGSSTMVPFTPAASQPAYRNQGLLAQLLDPDGSQREVKVMVAGPLDLAFALAPKVGSLSFVQNTPSCTTLDFSYPLQPQYNLRTELSQKDLSGTWKVDFITTGRYNLGASSVNIKTSDLPFAWCQANAPNFTPVGIGYKSYGFVGTTPGAWSALNGPRLGDKWIAGKSVMYTF